MRSDGGRCPFKTKEKHHRTVGNKHLECPIEALLGVLERQWALSDNLGGASESL